jgi:hypothetical protein
MQRPNSIDLPTASANKEVLPKRGSHIFFRRSKLRPDGKFLLSLSHVVHRICERNANCLGLVSQVIMVAVPRQNLLFNGLLLVGKMRNV